jgi:hypothetical protein
MLASYDANIVSRLSLHQDMQYRLIEMLLLKEKAQKGIPLKDHIKLLYIELTIKLEPEKLCSVLE